MNVSIKMAVGLLLAAAAGSSLAQQQVQLPSGTVPVGQPASQAMAAPAPMQAMAGLPAGAQPAPMVGSPLPPQAGAPQSLPPLPNGATSTAPDFDATLSQTLGLTPDQIRELRKAQSLRTRAASELPTTPPKPVTTSVKASPSPGSVAPVIHLYAGFASAVTFVDSTGALWPIENYAVGDSKIDVKRLDSEKGSMFSVAPLINFGQTNMIVYLKGLSAPIAISFIVGQKQVDFRVDVRVEGLGPNAQVAVAGLPASANTALLSLLDGVAPSGAKELRVSGLSGKAWMGKDGRMFLRTSEKVISPTWIGSARSADGTNVYEMMPTTSIRVLREGSIQTGTVEGW
jgi:intracellular multiplication protein IcmK